MLEKSRIKAKEQQRSDIVIKILMYVVSITTLILILGYILISLYYNNRFYKETMINGVDVSNLSVEQTEELIREEIRSYVLTLKGRNGTSEVIRGSDIALYAEFNDRITMLLEEQKGFQWIVSLLERKEYEIETILQYDENLLEQIFWQLECTQEDKMVEPINAHLSEYTEQGYVIIPEVPGTRLKHDILFEAIQEAILSLGAEIDIEEIGAYEPAQIHSESPQLITALYELNTIIGSELTYEFGEATEVLDGKIISDWIHVDESFNISLDSEGVKNYVDYIGRTYNTFGKTRTFQTTYGDVIKVQGGDYGWWLNRGKEVEEITKMILAGYKGMREPVYFQTAVQYGEDDLGDTYVEVNITAQHMFLYKEGKLIMETDFVSGNLARNYGTPTGTYPIQYKENDATLNGENYSTPVKYWMPYNGNIGFHDAPWRNKFGKDIYLKQGSHGCINMPPEKAKTLFEYVHRGMPVIVYELKGTENYEVKKEKPAAKKKEEKKKEITETKKNTKEKMPAIENE